MLMNVRTGLLALLCCAGLGCVLSQRTDGTGITDAQVASIEVGRSTRADVVRVLGAPDHIEYSNREHDPLFERAFQFERTRRKTTFFTLILFSGARTDQNIDNVIVFFDDDGIVEDVAARLDMHRPRYGGPWGSDD